MQESRERYFRRGALVLVMAYLFLALGHSVLNPICETSDEYWHIGFVAHLARGGTLPVQQPGVKTPWRQEGSQPPLYYWFEASLARLLHLPLADVAQACPPNPHANLGDATQLANRNLVLHGPWQRYPWRGMVFTIHFWRIVSVLMGLGTVLGAIWLTRTLFPRQPTWSLAVGAFVAFNPMYLFITSAVSNDALVIPLTTLTLALAAHSWRFGPTLRTSLLLGLLAGGAALTKLSGLTVWPWVAVALFLGARARGDSRAAWQYPLLALGSALLVSGWWFWRNWTLYHDPTGLNVMLAIVGERSATWRDLLREWEGFRRAFWGVFGGMNVLMPAWVYRILDGWTLVVFLGFVFAFLRAVHVRARTEVERWTGVLGYIGTVFVALLRWTMRTLASQGRLLFPALAPIGLVFWRGWTWWTDKISTPGWRRFLSVVPLAFLAFIALVAPPLWIAPVYDPTRVVRSTVPDDVIPHRVQFGQVVEMLGYRLQVPHPLLPGSEVQASLYFRRLDGPAQPWSLFVHLLDEVEVVLAQDDRYPMLGLVDMPRISPGTLWEEPVRLRVPDTAVAPAQVSLEWGFYNLQDGQRLPIAHVDPPQTRVLVGPWQLLPRPGPYPNPTSVVFGDRVELVGFEAAPRRLHPGDALHLVLYWRALRPMKHDYVVFTHILEPPDHIWGQEDRAPSVPTHLWKVGEVYREEYTLVLRPDTPPGLYEVEIGWYRPDTGERLLRPDGRNFLFLTRVRAVP